MGEALGKAPLLIITLQATRTKKGNSDETRETLNTAAKRSPTFYDAEYAQKAKTSGLTLVTEDRELLQKQGNRRKYKKADNQEEPNKTTKTFYFPKRLNTIH